MVNNRGHVLREDWFKDPDIILADEPTGNLDPSTAMHIINLLEKYNKNGKTVLMTSHNYRIIKELGHRFIEIKDEYFKTNE